MYTITIFCNCYYAASIALVSIYRRPPSGSGWFHATEGSNNANALYRALVRDHLPSVRLTHHVGRPVQAGHKVGLVRLVDTATLKYASDKVSGPFARQLCEICTVASVVGWAARRHYCLP
jgi:hypothetical protein